MHHQWQHSYLCAHSSSKVPIAPMENLLTRLPRLSLGNLRPTLLSSTECTCNRDLECSHCHGERPNGKLTFCSLLAGRWCRSLGRHSDHLIVHRKWEHSFRCACSSSKVPNAPMGKWLMCLPRFTLAQLRTLRSTTDGACHRNLENFPSPQWDFHMFCTCACRAAVSSSRVAR